MRFFLQRVTSASVSVDDAIVGSIGPGLLVLVGIAAADTTTQADQLVDKLVNLRIFADEQGKMNLSALDTAVELLLVSQFTLYGNCTKGRRPSFEQAAKPDHARELFGYVVTKSTATGLKTQTGVFQAHMKVELINDGPVTFLLEA